MSQTSSQNRSGPDSGARGAAKRRRQAQKRLDRLVTDLFEHPTELYRGYIDDPRNTDNAWVETTCHGFHCSAELGSLLSFPVDSMVGWQEVAVRSEQHLLDDKKELLNSGLTEALAARVHHSSPSGHMRTCHFTQREFEAFGITTADLENVFVKVRTPGHTPDNKYKYKYFVPTLSHIKWLPIHKVGRVLWYASHGVLLSGAVANLQQHIGKKKIDMLDIVVGFGQKELIDRVLLAPKLDEERSPLRLQRALGDALVRAASNRHFDLGILEALLLSGAKLSGLTLKDLFTDSRTQATAVGAINEHLTRWQALEKSINKSTYDPSRHMHESPWPIDIADELDNLLPGFSMYADRRNDTHEAVTDFDVMIWAICCGASELALFMWGHTSSPIRAALIGQQLCERILSTEFGLDHLMRESLKEAEAAFSDASVKILSLIDSKTRLNTKLSDVIAHLIYPDVNKDIGDEDEVNDDLLNSVLSADESLSSILSRHGTDDVGLIAPRFVNAVKRQAFEAVGRQFPEVFRGSARRHWNVRPNRLLELAIQFENQRFVSHPSCVQCVRGLWRGNRLRFQKLEMGVGLPLNYHSSTLLQNARLMMNVISRSLPEVVLNRRQYITTSWRVPLLKRWHYSLSHIAFAFFLVWFSYMPLCGALPIMYWCFMTWVISLVWQEILQFVRSPALALLDAFNSTARRSNLHSSMSRILPFALLLLSLLVLLKAS